MSPDVQTEIDVTKLVGVMAASFPNTQMSRDSIKAYVAMLKDIPLNILEASIEQCVVESEFLPAIGKIRDTALRLVAPFRREGAEAWGVVVKAMSDVGFYNSPKFDEPLITKMVDIMGWRTLCSSENQVADRAHFIKNYEILAAREIADAKLLPRARELRQLTNERAREITDGRAA